MRLIKHAKAEWGTLHNTYSTYTHRRKQRSKDWASLRGKALQGKSGKRGHPLCNQDWTSIHLRWGSKTEVTLYDTFPVIPRICFLTLQIWLILLFHAGTFNLWHRQVRSSARFTLQNSAITLQSTRDSSHDVLSVQCLCLATFVAILAACSLWTQAGPT